MAAYLRQSLAGLLPSERQAIEHQGFALSARAIELSTALDLTYAALDRRTGVLEDVEQPSGCEEFVVGAGETVTQGAEVETSAGVHTAEPTEVTAGSVSPLR